MTSSLKALPAWIFMLLGLGIVVRVALMVLYPPAALQNPDTIAYVTLPPFADSRQPSGYHLFVEPFELLDGIRALVLAQHALGVATAALLMAAARRLGCGWPLAGAAAALTLFGSHQLYLEHALLTEPLFTLLVAGALLAVLHTRDGRWAPAVAAGALAAGALCTRSIGLVVIAVAVLGVFLIVEGSTRTRVLRAVATGAAATMVLAVYLMGTTFSTNEQSGIGQWGGWYTYARAAPFAECRSFTPPAGTEVLCEGTHPEERFGPSWYMFDSESPARIHFDYPPRNSEKLRSFGQAAIASQPSAYADAVLKDLVRYVDDDFGRERLNFGGGYDTVALDRRDPAGEEMVAERLRSSFPSISASRVEAPNVIELYAAVFAIDGRVLLVLLALAAAGMALTVGRQRAGAGLYVAVAGALLVVPVLTIIYNARYAIPADLLLAVPAAVGAQAIANRMRPPASVATDSGDVATGVAPGGRAARPTGPAGASKHGP